MSGSFGPQKTGGFERNAIIHDSGDLGLTFNTHVEFRVLTHIRRGVWSKRLIISRNRGRRALSVTYYLETSIKTTKHRHTRHRRPRAYLEHVREISSLNSRQTPYEVLQKT